MKRISFLLLTFMFNNIVNAQVACNPTINVALDVQGEARLYPSVLLIGDPIDTFNYTISPNRVYTCEDIGTPQTVFLIKTSISDPSNTESCWSTINIEDKIPRDPLTISIISTLNVNLGLSSTLLLTPEMFLSGPPCYGCTYTVSPSSVTCENVGTPVNVIVKVRDRFCQENSAFATVNTFSGIGCSMRMFIHPFWINRRFYPGDPIPFFINLEQLAKRNTFKNVYAHFFISNNKAFDINKSYYVGVEKLNAKQKQKRSSIKSPSQLGSGSFYLVAILSDKEYLDRKLNYDNFSSFEFQIDNPKANQLSTLSNTQSISSYQQNILIDGFTGGEVKIYNIQGNLLKSLKIGKDESFSVSDLEKGILIIQSIESDGKLEILKYLNY